MSWFYTIDSSEIEIISVDNPEKLIRELNKMLDTLVCSSTGRFKMREKIDRELDTGER